MSKHNIKLLPWIQIETGEVYSLWSFYQLSTGFESSVNFVQYNGRTKLVAIFADDTTYNIYKPMVEYGTSWGLKYVV